MTVHYVDPINGSDAGDGTASKPWKTLAYVLAEANKKIQTRKYPIGNPMGTNPFAPTPAASLQAINAGAPIKPGDIIELRSGSHGRVDLRNAFNEDFITVRPASGAEPILEVLTINGAAKWRFEVGIKARALKSQTSGLMGIVEIGRSGWNGPAEDIVINGLTACGSEDYNKWSDSEWVSVPPDGGIATMTWGKRVSITNNMLYGVRNAILCFSDASLVEQNMITDIANDGIQFGGSDISILSNHIKEGRNSSVETLHSDGIQGWEMAGHGVNRNARIEGNSVMKYGRGKARTTGENYSYMQGISIFDGRWDGVKVKNNSVAVNIYHGIAMYGIDNLEIANNTVLGTYPAVDTWIGVFMGKNNYVPKNNNVHHNTTPMLQSNFAGAVRASNKVCKKIAWHEGGSVKWYQSPGVYGTDKIDPTYGVMLVA